MGIITWKPGNPEGQGEPAARGDFFNDLIRAKIYWNNVKGYFEITFTGYTNMILAVPFNTLQAAKEYAENEALLMLRAAIPRSQN